MRRLLALAAVVAGTFQFVVACDPLDPSPPLDGRTFLSVSVTESGSDRPLVPGTGIRLSFGDARLVASAGCNTLGGTYRLVDGRLVTDGLATTDIGCDGPRHAQDEWLASVLAGGPIVRLSDDALELDSGSVVIRFVDREVADADVPLLGASVRHLALSDPA